MLCAVQFNIEALAVNYHFQGILQKQLGIHKKKLDIFKCDKFEMCAAKLPPAMRLKFHGNIQYLVYSLHCTEYSVEINSEKIQGYGIHARRTNNM
jgi:hypothetical protein